MNRQSIISYAGKGIQLACFTITYLRHTVKHKYGAAPKLFVCLL
ncbi:MAG: hypothetical protein NVSMB49_26210 [Ktedonobacteraceae bacterium]